ncbi:hypothetical protein [Massilia sp. DWR3-1-1]|uniref:hypothetical protein n=1 Tax=Massilia sp. DWR3-1-1 TaxID=2804559 RepID=UPI003CEFBFBB
MSPLTRECCLGRIWPRLRQGAQVSDCACTQIDQDVHEHRQEQVVDAVELAGHETPRPGMEKRHDHGQYKADHGRWHERGKEIGRHWHWRGERDPARNALLWAGDSPPSTD